MIDIFAYLKKRGTPYEMITEGHNWCICWCEKEVCPTIKVWGESPDRSSPNKVRACGCSHNSFFVAWLLFYIFRNVFLVFAVAMPSKSYFDEFPIWMMVVQSVHSKFSWQGSWRCSMNVVSTVSSNSALHQALSMPNTYQISRCYSLSAKCLKLSKIVDFYNLKGEWVTLGTQW